MLTKKSVVTRSCIRGNFCTGRYGTSKNLERNGKFQEYLCLVSGIEGVKEPRDPQTTRQ